jgi:transposase
MSAVVIGVDPAKRSQAMEVIDDRERTQASGVFVNENAGYWQMRAVAARFTRRLCAVEGAGGVGKQLAQRLVADGVLVVDAPPKLSTRVRRCRLVMAARLIRPMLGRSRSFGCVTLT